MQLLDSDWPATLSHFRAKETQALSPDGVCALGTRLVCWLAFDTHVDMYVTIYLRGGIYVTQVHRKISTSTH